MSRRLKWKLISKTISRIKTQTVGGGKLARFSLSHFRLFRFLLRTRTISRPRVPVVTSRNTYLADRQMRIKLVEGILISAECITGAVTRCLTTFILQFSGYIVISPRFKRVMGAEIFLFLPLILKYSNLIILSGWSASLGITNTVDVPEDF